MEHLEVGVAAGRQDPRGAVRVARHAQRVQNRRVLIRERHCLDCDRERDQLPWLEPAGFLQCLEHGRVALQQRDETRWRLRCARLAVLVMVDEQHLASRIARANTAEDFSCRFAAFSLGAEFTNGLTRKKSLHFLFLNKRITYVRESGVLGFHRRSIAQRRSPLEVRGRLLELRCRARPHLPSTITPAQHRSPHAVCPRLVRRRPNNPRRQRLELLVVPPLRLGHLAALLPPQLVEGACRGLCPVLRAHRIALLGLEVLLCGLHVVPRAGEHCTKVVVRHGLVWPQGDGLAVGPGFFAVVPLKGVPRTLSHQPIVRVARLRGDAGLPLRGLAIPLLRRPTILLRLPLLPHLLVKHPVQLPSTRVRRAGLAAEVRRWQLLVEALIADGVLLPAVVHV
eukprot:scaffold53559_cov66-Phaeocystis_antarctica.AAC.2